MYTEPRVYVSDLAAYNSGVLHGCWIDVTQDLVDIQSEIQNLLKKSPVESAEEYAIHDYEGFGDCLVNEYSSILYVKELASFIGEHGEVAGSVLSYFGGTLSDAKMAMEEGYSGCYESLADFAEEITSQGVEVPESLAMYLDYERMGRDMELSGDIFTVQTAYNEVHVFWAN
ncbi:Antirestriction protein (ArdA) [Marinomonas gallaica]|uniref:Antirestriction protein (ArdA) n=2 Tax=Marinomonas gallaica TaxID=1806667 RepID=A0A1C3JRL9_9GAMM|nr:Antirestriction protein (ArdA) [Marinomonas gallaica]SBT20026.1 Antirestriction protein (ArdA) [Marinomonas gallaica]